MGMGGFFDRGDGMALIKYMRLQGVFFSCLESLGEERVGGWFGGGVVGLEVADVYERYHNLRVCVYLPSR